MLQRAAARGAHPGERITVAIPADRTFVFKSDGTRAA